jgi:hypothetical protein
MCDLRGFQMADWQSPQMNERALGRADFLLPISSPLGLPGRDLNERCLLSEVMEFSGRGRDHPFVATAWWRRITARSLLAFANLTPDYTCGRSPAPNLVSVFFEIYFQRRTELATPTPPADEVRETVCDKTFALCLVLLVPNFDHFDGLQAMRAGSNYCVCAVVAQSRRERSLVLGRDPFV